ncbi:MAG: DUF1573 domain-containing protein [Deltaproteobacteria bacterium]|nr:DUF1573 domain-containing protein [Deltaproteobacteria bacterium]
MRFSFDVPSRFLFLLVFLTLAIGACGRGDKVPPPPPGQIVADPDVIRYETVNQGETVRGSSTIRNTGETALLLGPIQVSCPCTNASVEQTYLQPGEETRLELTFDTASNPGSARQYITVMTDDPRTSPALIRLEGTVMPELVVSPELHRLDYAEVNDKTYTLTSEIRNARDEPKTITAVKSTGEGILGARIEAMELPATIPANGVAKLVITAKSPKRSEPIRGRVYVETDSGVIRSYAVLVMQDAQPLGSEAVPAPVTAPAPMPTPSEIAPE